MNRKLKITFLSLTAVLFLHCSQNDKNRFHTDNFSVKYVSEDVETGVITGADRIGKYLPILQGKRIALAVNHSSRIVETHIVDTLLKFDIDIRKIFAPEHGFRGDQDDGSKIVDHRDPATNIFIVSLYGQKRKPSAEDLADVDVVVFDIQDVGARFYTYPTVMTLIMEACAEEGVPLIVLDRPNPNGHYVDGPVLQEEFKAYIGMHPIPIVHGLTIGEMARMINEEGWLKNGISCDLTVIPCQNYDHNTFYSLPVRPSPNLPNDRSILLYPSLCLFEGTTVSVGRGTTNQFQIIGHPGLEGRRTFEFTPVSSFGSANPPQKNIRCFGDSFIDMNVTELWQNRSLDLSFLYEYYHLLKGEHKFFLDSKYINKLAGFDIITAMESGMTIEQMRETWQPGLQEYKRLRKKYLLYEDFE